MQFFFLTVFKGLQRRRDKAEGGDRRDIQGSFAYQLSVFPAPPFPVFHLSSPHQQKSRKQFRQLGTYLCSFPKEEQVVERIWEKEQSYLETEKNRWKEEALSKLGLMCSISITWVWCTRETGKKQGAFHGRITAERRAPGAGHLSANFTSMRLDYLECHQKRRSKRRGLREISPQLLLIRVNSDKLVGFISLWRLQERQIQEAFVYFKARLLVHFQTLSGWNDPAWQWHLHDLSKTGTTWHPCLETFSVSQEKSSLASAGTANLLKPCLWHQQFDLRESCWRFWAKLTWGSSNTEAAEDSRLPWGTNQLQFYITCAGALENETCSHSCLHQGKVTSGREKSQIPTCCQLWDEGSLALQHPFSCTATSVCSLFCI